MTEQKPVYTLEFILNYDRGENREKSFKVRKALSLVVPVKTPG